ncbi:MAG: ECF transporter S component [Actinomycetota bacterium]|nr:ECF transporter S component [Actinomycetota bacterium]
MTWQTTPFVVLALVLVAGFGWYERRRPPAKVIALVAALAALAVVGRLAFAAIPNVKPTTDIVLFAGYALGPVPGFMVGAVTALVSNVFLGHGPWTVWQMVAWGGVGVGGAMLARAAGRRELGRVPLAIACGVAGLAFGAFMDVYQWTLAAEQTLPTYLTVSGSSLAYNLAHAFGNVAFCLLIGPVFIRALRRYRRRFEVSWAAPPGTVPAAAAATAVVCLAMTAGLSVALSAPDDAHAASSPSARAASYLVRAQNRDGGFGGDRGQASSQLFTGWSALGLAAAGRNPSDVRRRGGRSVTGYLRTAGSVEDTGDLERTMLALRASGASVRSFRGRDLVAALVARRRRDGSWRRNVAFTAFGILALRASGEPTATVQGSARWLLRAQNSDGGWGFVARAESDVDDTGAALQALSAAGMGSDRAVGYLRRRQNGDGGFGQMEGRDSNAQSTAWAVQGLVAAGVRPESVGSDPIRYLVRLQRSDGHIAYSRTSDQTPVWVTAQALTALRKKPFPLAAVPRKPRARAASAAGSGGGGGGGDDVGGGRAGSPGKPKEEDAGAPTGRATATPPAAGSLVSPGTVVDTEPAGVKGVGEGESDGHGDPAPSAPLLAGGAAAALVLVGLLRRRLRARRPRAS